MTVRDENEAQKHSLFDVVVPIVGNDLSVDPNSIAAKLCAEQMSLEQISLADFSNHNERSFQ